MLRVIGDIHGKVDPYLQIARSCEYSVQLGDFGFSHAWNKLHYSNLCPDSHKVLAGNHDDYDMAPNTPYYMGDFGVHTLNGITFFFIRGGLSIDRVYRVGEELFGSKKTWWSQEELNLAEMLDCMKAYKKAKPDIVISHVPCAKFTPFIFGNKSGSILQRYKFHHGFVENTQLLGDQLLKIHQPKIWISGHMHESRTMTMDGTKFVALAELECFDLT